MHRARGNRNAGRPTALLAAVLLALPAPARAQAADDAAAAEVAFQEGNRLMAEGHAEEACPKFAASHRLDPGYGAIYNLGSCYQAIGKTASAWAAFREAAEWARKRRETQRYEKATRRAAELTPVLVKLRIVVPAPPDRLVLTRNGAAVDPALWGTEIPVDPGEYSLTASAPGRQKWARTVAVVEPGKTIVVEVPALAEIGPLPVTTTSGSPASARGGLSTQHVLSLGAAGVGASGLAVGAIFAALATSTWGQARQGHCDEANVCDERGVALHRDAKTMSHVSTAGFVAGGAFVAAAVTLWLTAPAARDTKTRQSLRAAPFAFAAGGGVLVEGSF